MIPDDLKCSTYKSFQMKNLHGENSCREGIIIRIFSHDAWKRLNSIIRQKSMHS
jgi:hypothetical protein